MNTTVVRHAAITQSPKDRRDRGPVKPAAPVRGRSAAEWLDWAEDRRTIGRRDGPLDAFTSNRPEDPFHRRDAQSGNRKEAGSLRRLSEAMGSRVRARF